MDVLVAWLDQTRAGDLASILGLVVALVGFAVTIYNVRASKAAALRAEQAALDARRAIGFFDAITELSAAIATLEEIRRMHRDGPWAQLSDRYVALRKALITIRASIPDLSQQQRARLQAAVLYLADLEREVEGDLRADGVLSQIPEKNARASDHVMELHTLLLEMKRRAGER